MLNVIIHEITHFILQFFFNVCINNDTRIATLVIEKKSSFLLALDHLGYGFYELQHVYSMHTTLIEIIDFFEILNSDCISINF
jgi:hypothetical protein